MDEECIDCGTTEGVEMRHPGYGYKSFPRCEACGDKRLAREDENKRKYFNSAGFDPMDAGEAWDEEDY